MSVGRLSEEKRFDRLICAHKRLLDSGVKNELHILGEGGERAPLEQLIGELSLENSVKLLGYRDNPYPYIKAADICVCSSDYEGLSTFITESLILGKAIVTTACGGMDELLGNNEYGIITDFNETALAEGIIKLLTDEALKTNYEQKAKVRGLDFSSSRLAAKTEEYIKNMLK